MKIYQVGGAVRDRLLGLPVKDHDWVVVGATPEEMIDLGYKPVGRDFPVFLHPETAQEYALARTERKTAPGYTGFVFNTSPDITLEQDLMRRDLTINAMAQDEHGDLIDPCKGREDLEQGILRHVSPAFVEDPLRVLRVARFAARFGFKVAPATMDLMQAISASGELDALVAERVWQETKRALGEDRASLFFIVLKDCGALARVFPELDGLYGVPQPEHYHPEIDSGVHTMMVLDQACRLSADTMVRFAALVHDLGKAATPQADWPAHRDHERRGVELVNRLCERYRVPKKFRELAVIVTRYHLDCHRVQELRPGTVIDKLESMDAFRRPGRFEQFLLACEADARGRKGLENTDYPQADRFRALVAAANAINTKSLPVNELDGKEMAQTIRQLRIDAISGEFPMIKNAHETEP